MEKKHHRLIGRLYAITNYGYNVIGWIISLIGWTSIIGFVLTKYIPIWLAYVIIPLSVAIAAFVVGYFMIKKGIYKQQNAIATEQNPYLSKIIGWKDYLGYKTALRSMNMSIEDMNLNIRWFKSMKYNTEFLEQRLSKYQQLKAYYEELLNEANVMKDIPDILKED